MIHISNKSKIFIACIANHATGGTELLHQFCNKLNAFGFNASMYYVNINKSQDPIHPNFKKYDVTYSSNISDDPENVLIVTETQTSILFNYSKIRKIIWWLSVDFFFRGRKSKIETFLGLKKKFNFTKKNAEILHIAQSYYALDFLKQHDINGFFLSDFLNSDFLSNAGFSIKRKQDIVLYNPLKGIKFTKRIIKKSKNIKWIPLINMTSKEIIEYAKIAKVYIDFGFHPGKDRFPRECALNGCCIITNKKGSANFHEDIPIPHKYKYEDKNSNIDDIIGTIKNCFNNYADLIDDFKLYREWIQADEERFEKDLKAIFQKY